MSCLLLLALAALATAFLLGRNQPLIAINNGSNNQGALPAQETRPVTNSSPASGIVSSANRAPAAVNRMAAPSGAQVPAYYATLNPVSKVQFRVRGLPGGPVNMKGPVPFRMRQYQAAADGRVVTVYADKPVVGQKDADAVYSFLPDVSFSPSASKGKGISVNVVAPRKSAMVNGLRAPKGYQFLVAELLVSNFGSESLALDPEAFEVRDKEDISYLVNPELLGAGFPRQPLPGGAQASFQIAFLVPADATLVSLVTTEPDGAEQISALHPI